MKNVRIEKVIMSEPKTCKCYRHPDSAFTVKVVNEKKICPRCGGEIVFKNEAIMSELETIRLDVIKDGVTIANIEGTIDQSRFRRCYKIANIEVSSESNKESDNV